MDSESAAQASAQQKHHKHMMFGKKQRYIEVFQCSGEDMNMVLNGSSVFQYQSPPAITAKPLTSLTSGMLPSSRPQTSVQPLQVSIPPPLSIPLSLSQQGIMQSASNQNAINVTAGANQPTTASSLIAQQQQQTAHFIAQQNLMARQQAAAAAAQLHAAQQSADQMAFLQNFSFLPSSAAAASSSSLAGNSAGGIPSASNQGNPYAFQFGQQMPQFFYLPRPMLPMGLMQTNLGQIPTYNQLPPGYITQAQLQNLQATGGAHMNLNHAGAIPQSSTTLTTNSVKRSYENAFRNDPMNVAAAAAAAKRAYHPNQSHAANIYGNYPYPQL
jgi:epithelial splicing regulatory protein 1/2